LKIPPNALISPDKLTKYLLVPRSKNDKSQFLAGIGFVPFNWRELERAIRQVAASVEARRGSFSPHGEKWIVDGIIEGPTKLKRRVRTLLAGGAQRRFSFRDPGAQDGSLAHGTTTLP